MTTLRDDEIQTIATDGSRLETEADADGDDSDAADADADDADARRPRTQTRTTPRTRRTTARRAARAALARCLDPVDAETFFAEHWERRPLVVPRDERGRFDDLLSEADVERLVCSTAIRYPAFRLVREGGQLDVCEYTRDVSWRPPFTGTADVPRVLAEWEAGATIVLQALHVNWHPLAVFCRLLEDALGNAVQVNAYYTPRGSQGFAVHHDTHDVLVLQVAGEKQWRLYDPLVELPLKHQRYSQKLGGHGPPVDDLVLRSGDTLYLPRGWLHEAETSTLDSLHLTIGITAYTWLDALKEALAQCESELAFRRGLDGTRPTRPSWQSSSRDGSTPISSSAAAVGASSTRAGRSATTVSLSSVRSSASSVDSFLERRATVIADLEEWAGGLALVFEGKEIRFPTHAAPERRGVLRAGGAVPDRRPSGRARRRGPARPRSPPRSRGLSPDYALITRCLTTR